MSDCHITTLYLTARTIDLHHTWEIMDLYRSSDMTEKELKTAL